MSSIPESIARFLDGERIAVAGVSRDSREPANAIAKRLRRAGHTVVPLSSDLRELDGQPCYPDVTAIPGGVDGLFVAAGPAGAAEYVRQCAAAGVRRVWFHWTIGEGHVPEEAARLCAEHGIVCIDGGCPLMFCEPVDPFHRCLRWWGQRTGHVPR